MALSREASWGSGFNGGGGVATSALAAPPRQAALFACVTTMTNTVLGVSVVGVAGGFSRAGCAVGTISLVLFATLAASGLHLLARSAMTVSAAARCQAETDNDEAERGGAGKDALPPTSFRALALVGAPRWAFLIDLAVALKCFGVATSYLVVVGDLMPTAMSDIIGESHPDSFFLERRFWVTVGFVLAAPLAFSRTLGALKYTATLAIGLVIFLAGMVIAFWLLPGLDACPGGETGMIMEEAPETAAAATEAEDITAGGGHFSQDSATMEALLPGEGLDETGGDCFEGSNAVGPLRDILQTLPIFVFCFTCHQNIFTICNEIVRPTPRRIDAVIACSMFVAMATYMSLSWGAYATFGVGVDDDLLETYPRTGLLTVARVCVSMVVVSCYPLQAHPSRLCVISTWKAFAGEIQEAYSKFDAGDATTVTSPSTGASGYTSVPVAEVNNGYTTSNASVTENSDRSGREGVQDWHYLSPGAGGAGQGQQSDVHSWSGDAGGAGGGGGEGVVLRRSTSIQSDASSSSVRLSSGPSGVVERGSRRRVSPKVGRRGELRTDEDEAGGDSSYGGVRRATVGNDSDGGDIESAEQDAEMLLPSGTKKLSDDDPSSSRFIGKRAAVGGGVHPRGEHASDVDSAEGMGEEISGEVFGEEEKEGGKSSFWTSREGFRHVTVTTFFLALSYAIAMAVDDLGVLLEVVGATGSTTIAFILPGLLYLKVHPEPHPKRSLAALQLAAGLLIIPVALTFIALGDSAEGRR